MKQGDESRVWVIVGALGSMALGIALIPLRSVTSASNLAFVFLVFTIVVAELGGRSAGLVTAIVSAISLNFFLTEPYLRLTISKPDDIVAFFALAVCGLIAAAFGRRRERWSDLAGREGKELDVVKKLVERLRDGRPLEEILADLKHAFGLGAVAIRGAGDQILAVAPPKASPGVPDTRLTPDTLIPSNETRIRFGSRGVRLPEGGGRLRSRPEQNAISLDLWEGDPQGFILDEARTLTIAASILEIELSRPRQAGTPAQVSAGH
jgi:Domain of unknown function (DUF4118)